MGKHFPWKCFCYNFDLSWYINTIYILSPVKTSKFPWQLFLDKLYFVLVCITKKWHYVRTQGLESCPKAYRLWSCQLWTRKIYFVCSTRPPCRCTCTRDTNSLWFWQTKGGFDVAYIHIPCTWATKRVKGNVTVKENCCKLSARTRKHTCPSRKPVKETCQGNLSRKPVKEICQGNLSRTSRKLVRLYGALIVLSNV